MTVQPQENQAQDTKQAELDKNFAQQRKHYEKQLEAERQARAQAEERATMAEKAAKERERMSPLNEDDEDDEPYVDKKRFKKGLNQFGEQIKQQTKAEIEQAVQSALEQERRQNYLKDNSDFNQVMTPETIQRFAEKHPRLADNILRMPDGFERQKLVYENIKALGIDKPEAKQPSIQDKIDANRKSPYYQPSSVGTAPYSNAGNYTPQGQKDAYAKMQELKNRLRI